jgi:hypothetical protein
MMSRSSGTREGKRSKSGVDMVSVAEVVVEE